MQFLRQRRGNKLRHELETLIIGGGVIGNSIAYHLSERMNQGIAVVDRHFPLSGTSGATQAWVWIHTKTPATYAQFSMISVELYPFLERKIGNVEYHRCGGLAPFFHASDRDKALQLAENQAKVGIPVEVLSRDEALAIEPALSPEIAGATFSRIDGCVNPFRLVEGYMKAAKKNGVQYRYYNKVIGMEKKKGVFIVTSEREEYRAKNVIIAAGPWSREVGQMLGIHIPIRPVRGQVLVTEPLAPVLNHVLMGLRQTDNGEILLGYSAEEAGFNRSSTLDVIQSTARMAISCVPALATTNIVRCFSGLRAIPEDDLPIIGKVPTVENLYVAAMHSGITLSPLAGTLMAELILEGETSISIEDYSIARFSK
jgi:sarcosine oxidase subunit beta